MDERTAIQRLRQGDITGMEYLVRTYQAEALRAANLITRDRALAEDVVQDGFIQAWERIGTFDPERSFGPWFRRCVVNLALKAVQRRGRQVSLIDDEHRVDQRLVDSEPEPDELLEMIESAGSLRQAIDHLSPDQRAAVVLRYYGGFSDREAGERLGRPAGTVKWWLHSARRRLRRLLAADQPDHNLTANSGRRREDDA